MARTYTCIGRYVPIAIICVISCAMSGCIESSFNLASESRLPGPMVIPPGVTGTDVSVTLNSYTGVLGPDAKVVLDRQ